MQKISNTPESFLMPFISKCPCPLLPLHYHYSNFYNQGLILPVLELCISGMTSGTHDYVYNVHLCCV